MLRRFVVVLAALTLIAGACGSDDDEASVGDDPASEPGDDTGDGAGGADSVTVNVDGEAPDNNVAFLQYFPAEVTVQAGTTIDFEFQPGDPHTVSFGSLVDEMLAAGPDAEGPPPVPFALDEENNVIQAGAQPCFVAEGEEIPTDGACATQEAPAFTGSDAFYNSGLLVPGDTFTVEVAEDAAPGTYSYICLLHGPDMGGTVTVVGADEEAQTAEEVAAAAEAELDETVSSIEAELAGLETGTIPALEGVFETGPGYVAAGSGNPDAPVDILEFGPAEVEIEAGDTVTWNVFSFHTISFNATEDATPPLIVDADGNMAVNPLSFAPQGGWPGAPAPPEGGEGEGEGEGGEEGPPPPPTNIDAGEWDGTGFVSSGALPSFPPQLFSYSVTFTEAGTYNYVCLIHDGMEGTVNVT